MPSSAKIASEFSLSPSAAKLRLLKKLRCTLRYEKMRGIRGGAGGGGR